jgi:hypothetical protein
VSGLDLIFQLLTLLLGLSIAELLMGLARSWRLEVGTTRTSHESIHIGLLVPLLALMVLFDQTHFWVTAYALREFFQFDYLRLLAILFVIGGYYVISTFVFPDEPEQWPDFDDYYLASKRPVVGGVIIANVATAAFGLSSAFSSNFDVASAPVMGNAVALTVALAYFPCLAALWLVRSPKVNLVLLIAANMLLLTEAIAQRLGVLSQ